MDKKLYLHPYYYSCQEFGLRLAKLREEKKVSARQMSLDMGQNKNYINSIESGNNYPTMRGFFDICSYLEIPPQNFFSTVEPPYVVQDDFLNLIYRMSPQKFQHLYMIACDLAEAGER